MKIQLHHRHHGVHSFVRDCEVAGVFEDYAKEDKDEKDEFIIDEQKLIKMLPPDFLPKLPPRQILVSVSTDYGSAGQRKNIKLFLPWAKYFDAYKIELIRCEDHLYN